MPLKHKFDQVLEFPCDQHMRIVVLSDESQPERLIDTVNEILPGATGIDGVMGQRLSANGKYTSYQLRVTFQSAEQMEQLYDQLAQHDFVMHVL
ncbi:MAG TPA: DUF493 domain-containing protein [Candidatus Anaerobiospirillum stercoravium]|nr:DUF493 domain-containing protein [Candidatus Anaerobiospirillum stercoravium]